VGLAASTASLGGAVAAASHTAKTKPLFQDATAPTWSPDGREIAYTRTWSVKEKNCCGSPPSLEITRYRIVRTSSRSDGPIRRVFSGEGRCCRDAEWPVSDRLLFTTEDLELRSVSSSGGKSRRVDFPGCPSRTSVERCGQDGYVLSPDRKYAAAAVGTFEPHTVPGIALVKLSRGRFPVVVPTQLTSDENTGTHTIYDRLLAFSPDGTQLVFSRSTELFLDDFGPPALMAIHVAGGGPIPFSESGIPGASLVPSDATQLQWSPDGRWIAYVENDLLGNRLQVVSTAGGSPRILPDCGIGTDVWEFAWSPNSKSFAYDCYGYDGDAPAGSRWTWRFMTAAPDGTNPADLLKDHRLAWASQLQWSPDGSRLLFVAHRISHRPTHVWTIRPDGHDLSRIA
jgi:Tol biopolymer transport system component